MHILTNLTNLKYRIKRLYREEKRRLYSELNRRNYDYERNYARNNNNNNNNNNKIYIRRLRLVLGTELSEKNKIQAIASLAIPVLRDSFGIIK